MRTKRKTISHIIDTEAIKVIHNLLPQYWSIRSYQPDYGLDLSIELFDEVKGKNRPVFDTLGEHLFVQVKGRERLDKHKLPIRKRMNIEKGRLKEDELQCEIEVVKCKIDTIELRTIERMSNAVIVMLFVVDIENKQIFYANLNDYIDKVIVPADSKYYLKQSKIINIPVENRIAEHNASLSPLLFYAKRPKYYAFFNKVSYQTHELNYISDSHLVNQCQHFADVLLRFDIWDQSNLWPILDEYKRKLLGFLKTDHCNLFKKFEAKEEKTWHEPSYQVEAVFCTQSEGIYYMELRALWSGMSCLYNLYEEYCREWFIPTMINGVVRSVYGKK